MTATDDTIIKMPAVPLPRDSTQLSTGELVARAIFAARRWFPTTRGNQLGLIDFADLAPRGEARAGPTVSLKTPARRSLADSRAGSVARQPVSG